MQYHGDFNNVNPLRGSSKKTKKRENKGQIQKKSTNSGQEYVGVRTQKTVSAKKFRPYSNTGHCKKRRSRVILIIRSFTISQKVYKMSELSYIELGYGRQEPKLWHSWSSLSVITHAKL